MLAFLATRGEARREELIELLWGGAQEANARNAFRQALHRLRTALGEQVIPQDPDRVRLGVEAGQVLSVDRDAFLQLVNAGQPLKAMELYRGDFLEGFELGESSFDQWAESERTRLRTQAQAVLRQVAQAALESGHGQQATQFAQRLTRLAPFDEDAALLEASVLIAAGRGEEAAATLQRFATRLREELDLAMPTRVRDMLARLERSSETKAAAVPKTGIVAPPFVNRAAELSTLLGFVSDLAREHGATVLIEGRTGIGKTRLVEELLRRAKPLASLLVLHGRERAAGAVVPYAGLAEALRGALDAPGVAGTSQHLLAEAARILPELRDAFALPPLSASLADSGVSDDAGSRLRLFEGVAALLDSVAYEQPVCVVIDDVHQASASTLDILAYLSGRLQASPVLFLLVYRAEGAAVRLPERFGLEDGLSENDRSAHTSPLATRLTVQPLAEHDAEQLVRAFMSHRGPAPQVDVDRIVGAGGGVPAKLMHFARAALAGELPSASVVEFRDVLWSRLQSCSPSQRRVFFAAALLQRHSSLSLLAAAAHLPEAATLDAAQALQQMELLAEVGPGYVIAHDVTTNFVVEASGTAGRALLAGWAADALAHDDPHANAELAHLYALAGRTNEAFTHARLAGFQALGARAGVELGRLLGLALTFAPDDRSRREIEQLLASWGSGHRRLPTPEDAVPVDADVVADVEAPSLEGSGETGTSAEEIGPESPDSERPTADRPAAAVAQRPAVRPWYRVRAGLLAAAGLTIALATASRLLQVRGRGGGRVLRDSLLVIPLGADHRLVRPPTVRVITGDIDMTADRIVPRGGVPRLLGPRWIDSVPLPWTSPLPSPDGRFVSLERVGSAGTDVYAVSADRRDTLPLAVGGGQDIAHGWSPDGRYLLVSRARTLRDGSFDSDLWAYPVAAGAPPIPIDTASDRAVTEAAWSPVGTRVAWVARVGADRQQDVFVARPDGSDLRNVSNHPSEDYHIAWSPDGTLIGFTSERTGNANLYAMDVSTSRLWRLTSGDAHDDGLMFSPDGRYAAFESTRGGSAGLYVMPALGGSATRVTPSGAAYALAGWRGQTPGYVARVRIVGPSALPAGDSASWSVIALDSRGDATSVRDVVWEQGGASPLARVVREVSGADAAESGHAPLLSAIGSGDGLLRLVVSIPGWRADTLFVRCGTAEYALLEDAFTRPLESARWFVLGAPVPAVETARGVSGLYPHADLEWESGVLSRSPIDVRENLSIEATMHAQFTGRPTAASSLRIALVAPADMTALDRAAPQFSDLVSVSWDGESRRVTYTVDRESRSEAAGALGAGAAHVFRIVVERGGRIAFYVDEKLRWRSTLQVPLGGAGDEGGLKSQLWLGGRATGDWGAFSGLRVTLEAASSRR